MVRSAVHLSELDMRRLELGVTEAVFLDLPETGFVSLSALKNIGV